ncbi:hypothetical protein [Cellulomonas sp. Root137]|uniref:hypothetical protein n=1 Tax=Cellulomonas sp. Root137 TaxID=1736459 RepID=UPI0006FF38F5|nr:hypothetical protein [Cellulomonas sp. Root137]KQY45989.1 hypothetical protein ASD18_00380 [Cellulomonas sp. Root137]
MSRRLPRIRRRHALVAVVGALLLALVGGSLAQASALTLTARLKPFTTSQSRCTSQTVAVTNPATSGTTSSVVLSNVDTVGCSGRALVVTVYDPTVTTWPAARRLEATGTVTTATATLTAATGSFTPAAGLKVHVTIGGWQVPATWTYTPPAGPVNVCQVRNANGTVDATKPCSVVGAASSNYWGTNGSGQGNFDIDFSAPGISNSQYVSFTVTIPGAPAWWTWSTSGLTSANNGAQVTSSCSALPQLSGRLAANIGATPGLYAAFVENRAGQSGIVCQIP